MDNGQMTMDNSPCDKISPPGTPGTPRRLDNPSILKQTPPDMGAPNSRPERRKMENPPLVGRGCIRRISRSALDCPIALQAFPGAGRFVTLLRLASAAQSRSYRVAQAA